MASSPMCGELTPWNSGLSEKETAIHIASTGAVGVGTTTPSGQLHIKSAGGTTNQLILQNSDLNGLSWAISDGLDAAGTLSFQNATNNATVASIFHDNTNGYRSLYVGAHSGAQSGIDSIGVGQLSALFGSGRDGNYAAIELNHGFSPPFGQFSVGFRNTGNTSNFEAGKILISHSGQNQGTLSLKTYNGASLLTALFIDQNQNIGLNGNTSPTHPIDAAGGAFLSGGQWQNGSSREYKKEIHSLESGQALSVVMALNPVRYRLKAAEDERYVGFIAEDVPELVASKGRKGLSPMNIIGVLTKVVQEQQKKLDEIMTLLGGEIHE